MKINKNLEAIIITLLYLTTIYFWTLPIQKNPMPYGEVDASSHYSIADYTYKTDRSVNVLPYYIEKRYGRQNMFKENTLWYPPPFHTTLAMAAVFGGGSNVPIFLANAILSSLIVLGVYFIMRKFFGFEAALLSSFLVIFSMRDIMIYLWGQWPERVGFAYIPLIIYCFYRYCSSYLKKSEKPIYLYIMSLLLIVNFFMHPMDFFHSVLALLVIGLFFLIKERKLFFSVKHLFASIILFLLIISVFPLQSMNVLVRLQSDEADFPAVGKISRLFYWFKPPSPEGGPSVSPSYFSYKAMIGPYWTIPFIFFGVLFLLFRRNMKDLVILGWLVSLYIMVHLDVIGKGRVHRSLSGTAHIFYPLMVLGLIYAVSLVPKLKGYKKVIKYGLMSLFAVFIFMSIGPSANETLKGSYGGVLRLNPYQYEFIQWLDDSSVPEDSNMYHMGSISLAKTRWIWMMGHRYIVHSGEELRPDITHIIMDYSDFSLIGDQNTVNKLQEFERQNLLNNTLVYDKDYIKVYKLEN